jgi:GrpB-like predicted nucleotidyltransferase (UPF0157 family)
MKITVLPHDPQWLTEFRSLREVLRNRLGEVRIEHVGSTSVPGLFAKPVLDIDIIIPSRSLLSHIVEELASLGYSHGFSSKQRDDTTYDPTPNLDAT